MKNIRILLVDDVDIMHTITRSALHELGFRDIVAAYNGETAFDMLRQEQTKVDLIISDWHMPKMNGLELLKEVRKNSALANTPFVLMTAEADKDKIIEAVKAQVNQYILKPYSFEQLGQKIKCALAKSSAPK